jgi:hypothetical protein
MQPAFIAFDQNRQLLQLKQKEVFSPFFTMPYVSKIIFCMLLPFREKAPPSQQGFEKF